MRELTLDMQERQRKLVAASVKEKSIWSGQLEMQLPDKVSFDFTLYCLSEKCASMSKLERQMEYQLANMTRL